jgi:hypothetical protein
MPTHIGLSRLEPAEERDYYDAQGRLIAKSIEQEGGSPAFKDQVRPTLRTLRDPALWCLLGFAIDRILVACSG